MKLKIHQNHKLNGEISIPGDKSISHRSLIVSSLADGKSKISGFLESEDCLNTLYAFRNMGVKINKIGQEEYKVTGVGLNGLKPPTQVIDCGNSGTCMRIISGLLSAQKFYTVLSGDKSLRSRPMDRIINPLTKMGAKIWARNDKYAPLSIKGSNLQGLEYNLPVASAQVKSSLLLAGLYAEGKTCLTEPGPSRDHTERMLKAFGVPLKISDRTVILPEKKNFKLQAQDIIVPGDISSAAFFMAAALITDNSEILIKQVGLNPTRSGIIDIMGKMEAKIDILDKKQVSGETIADVLVKSSQLKAVEIKGDLIPRAIDEIPIIAVLATQAQGKTIIKDAEELRVKETDRITAIVNELSKLGANIEERQDGMIIEGPTQLKGGVSLNSYGDHRIAMSLAIAALICEQKLVINNCDCIKTSFPGFEKILTSL